MNARRPFRRSLLPILTLAALLAASLDPATAESTGELFDRYEIVTGTSQHQTILTGFFLEQANASLAVVAIEADGDRSLRIFGFSDGLWGPRVEAALARGVQFVDVAKIAGHDRLITYTSGRVSGFDPVSNEELLLVVVPTLFQSEGDGSVPVVDIARDLNNDGRDDLVVPSLEGFWISTQEPDGTFTDPVLLGPPEPFRNETSVESGRTYGDLGITTQTAPWYLSRLHKMDYNLDDRIDLVFWNEDHFEVHIQRELGRFEEVSTPVAIDVAFDADGTYSMLFGHGETGVWKLLFGSGEKITRKILHSLRDLNGDGIADMVLQTLEGRTLLRLRSVYEVHLGIPTPHGLRFGPDADLALRPGGRAGGLQASGYSSQWFGDIDGDGQIDVVFLDVAVGFGGMFRAMVGNSVPVNLELHRLMDGAYPEQPSLTRKIRRFDPLDGTGNVYFPMVLIGDVTGDGRADLFAGKSPEEVRIYLGEPGPTVWTQEALRIDIAQPSDESRSWLTDLNQDGKQDLVMHLTPKDRPRTGSHRVKILIAR